MNELGLVCIGVVLALACVAALRWIDKDEARRRTALADAVLRRHGLVREQYVASADTSDVELIAALDEFGSRGHIILDAKGMVVGALCPRLKKKRYLRVLPDGLSNELRDR